MATYNSSSINRDPSGGRIGVYPIKVLGSINIASNTTLGSGAPDTLPICYIPFGSFISNWFITFPAIDGGSGLGLKLVDNLSSPTTYLTSTTTARAGGQINMYSSTSGTTDPPKQGIMYGNTARSLGASGQQVVVWTSGTLLQLSVITSATNTSGGSALQITYMVEFSPAYDMGV